MLKQLLLQDIEYNEDITTYAIITVDTEDDLDEVIDDIRNQWYERDLDCFLVDYIERELKKRYNNLIFNRDIRKHLI